MNRSKVINTLATLGAVTMQLQILPMIYDSWANNQQIPLMTTFLVVMGLSLISLRYRGDWFILGLNGLNITLHLLIQIPRLF